MGSEGELWGNFKKRELYYQRWGQEAVKIDLEALCEDFSGHGGGDTGIMIDTLSLFRGETPSYSICDVRTSYENHITGFAAEESRLRNQVISLAEYEKSR